MLPSSPPEPSVCRATQLPAGHRAGSVGPKARVPKRRAALGLKGRLRALQGGHTAATKAFAESRTAMASSATAQRKHRDSPVVGYQMLGVSAWVGNLSIAFSLETE